MAQKFKVGQKVYVSDDKIRTVIGYCEMLTRPYLVTDSDGENRLESGESTVPHCDTNSSIESSLTAVPDLEITVKINGVVKPLSAISEETLLKLRNS